MDKPEGIRVKKRNHGIRMLLCLGLLAAILTGNPGAFPPAARAEVPMAKAEQAAPDVRVLLRRLNLTDRIDLTLQCGYLASWDRESRMLLPAEEEIAVQVRENRLILFYRGAALDCGSELRLARMESAGTAAASRGLTIAPWEGLYPGDLRLTVSGGQLQPVLTINVEDYLAGVVPYEMNDEFPLEALKAQAVCARTYALSRVDPKKDYDLVDTTNDQVFRPILSSHPRTIQAIGETAGVVVTSGGKLANCYYSASNGGQTELPAHVWSGAEASACYAIVDDPWDLENPESLVKKATLRRDGRDYPEAFLALLREAAFSRPEMTDYVRDPEAFRVDALESLTLTTPRFDAPSRLMTKMELRIAVSGKQALSVETPEPPLTYEPDGEDDAAAPGATETPGPTATPEPEIRLSDFRSAGTLALQLDIFPETLRSLGLSIYGADNEIVTVGETEDAFVLSAGRYGHGVGMSQRGAQWMADKYGKTFAEILAFYYPGMELKKAPAGGPALPTPDPVLAETPGPAATPTPRPTLMPVSAENLPEGAWLASVEGIEDDSTLNLRAEPSPAGEILMRLYKHQRLIVLETCEDPVWVHVRTDSAEGYVMVSFLEHVDAAP